MRAKLSPANYVDAIVFLSLVCIESTVLLPSIYCITINIGMITGIYIGHLLAWGCLQTLPVCLEYVKAPKMPQFLRTNIFEQIKSHLLSGLLAPEHSEPSVVAQFYFLMTGTWLECSF